MSGEDFAGRTALVTGGSRGIGRAIALGLARGGASVAVNYVNDEDAAESVMREIEAVGGRATAIQADVADPDQVHAMVHATADTLGPIDLLACNAGVGGRGADLNDFEAFRRLMRINVDGVFLPIMAVKDGMMSRGFGRIVTIASIAGLRARPQNVHYSTSKAAVIAFARSLSGVLAPAVRINTVAPGLIETDMTANMNPERKTRMIDDTPLKRIGQPEEIAEMALFLLSERSSYTTGQTFVASGGRVTLP